MIKSLMTGNAFIGSTVIGFSTGNSLSRVMHINFGMPFTSAEHDPHLPALQFHRHARSGACVRWMSCTASSTTIPSDTSVAYSRNAPPLASPRQTLNVAFMTDCVYAPRCHPERKRGTSHNRDDHTK